MTNVISCEEVKALLDSGVPDVLVLDCHFTPNSDFGAEYKTGHIPGSPHFDVSKASYKTSTVPRELSQPEDFQSYARSLGVCNSTRVILYDRSEGGILGAARAWFLFDLYGHKNVSIMNGGLGEWTKKGYPVSSEAVTPKAGDFTATWNPHLLLDHESFVKFLKDQVGTIVDCRPPGFFKGDQPIAGVEGLKGCRVKGAINAPLSTFVSSDGVLKTDEEIKKVLDQKGVLPQRLHATLCNSGMQAAGVTFVLSKLGYQAKHYNGAYFQLARCNPDLIDEKP